MYRAVSVEVMRASDAWTIANKVSSRELMRRAGEGIYREAEWKGPVAVVCGSGNNAGDGYVTANLLHAAGVDVTVVLLEEKFSADGRFYFDICTEQGVPVKKFVPAEDIDTVSVSGTAALSGPVLLRHEEQRRAEGESAISDFAGFAVILDCILGTGFRGEPRGAAKAAIEAINASGAYVVSADINSGLNGDTGEGSVYVRSDLTVSIGDFKLGHFKGLADTAMKSKVNVDIGIEIQGDYVWFEMP